MTMVHFRLADPSGIPLDGSVSLVPTRRVTVGDEIRLPTAVRVRLESGEATVDMLPSTTQWVWRVAELVKGGITRYVAVPDTEGTVEYADLESVDPSSLDVSSASVPAWEIATRTAQEMLDRVGEIDGKVERAEDAAAGAESSASEAESHEHAARSSADAAASSARDAALSATAAASSAGSAAQSATAAAQSASEAQNAVNNFGLEAGTTTTGDPGTNASVELVKDGTRYRANFTIPRGDKGDKGETGDCNFATFDVEDGNLMANTTQTLANIQFSLNGADLEVEING